MPRRGNLPMVPEDVRRLKAAREEGYRCPVVLDGLICCVQPFAYTWGILVGIDTEECMMGYERRYCYERSDDALKALARFTDPRNSHPSGPWIKVKGVFKGRVVDDLNPFMFSLSPVTGLMTRVPGTERNGNDDEDESRSLRRQKVA